MPAVGSALWAGRSSDQISFMGQTPPPAHLRIGIVGAGCAGLTAAEELKKKGYTNVTVLEAKKRAGGKVITIPFSDENGQPQGTYEGGTVFYLPGKLYSDYARRYQMSIVYNAIPRCRTIDLNTMQVTSPYLIESPLPLSQRLGQLWRFMSEMTSHHEAQSPGFNHAVFKRLGDSCSFWFTNHGLEFARDTFIPLANALQFPSIGGPIPVAYLVKTLALLNRLGVHRRLMLSFPKFKEGNQVLWQRVAEQHRVLFRTPVKKIRRGKTVRVEVPQGELEFDRLIWAAPMEDFPSVADADEDTQDIVRRIRNVKRAVITCRIDGLPSSVCYFIRNTVNHEVPINYPYAIYEVQPGTGVYNLYPYMHDDTSVDDMVHNVYDLARRLGASKAKLIGQPLIWKWFPYFAVEDFKRGIYERFELMQGENNTFFVGEILSGVGVAFGMEYAANIVERFFPHPTFDSLQTRPLYEPNPRVSPPSAFDLTMSSDNIRPFPSMHFRKDQPNE